MGLKLNMMNSLLHNYRFLSGFVLLALCINCNPLDSGIASEHDEYAWLVNALLAEQKDKTIAVAISRHGDVYSYIEKHGSATKAMESTYYIESYDVATMKRIAQKEIAINEGEKSIQPQIIGKDAERIWLFTDQLMAYHCSTLEPVVNREKLEQKNPGLKNILLNEAKYYRWDNKSKTITITAADGITWQLNTQALAASPIAPSSVDKAEQGKRNRKEDLWRRGSEQAFKSNQDTLGNIFYGLYSAAELPVSANTFRNDAASSLDAVRNLWFTPFRNDAPKIAIDIKDLESLSDKKFINGFFVVDRNTYGTFHCVDPTGFLIGYKTAIGKTGMTRLARIGIDGNVLWDVETKINEIKGIDLTHRYALIQATGDDTNNLITKMYSIRLTDGKISEAGL